jgi:hypothetical protein
VWVSARISITIYSTATHIYRRVGCKTTDKEDCATVSLTRPDILPVVVSQGEPSSLVWWIIVAVIAVLVTIGIFLVKMRDTKLQRLYIVKSSGSGVPAADAEGQEKRSSGRESLQNANRSSVHSSLQRKEGKEKRISLDVQRKRRSGTQSRSTNGVSPLGDVKEVCMNALRVCVCVCVPMYVSYSIKCVCGVVKAQFIHDTHIHTHTHTHNRREMLGACMTTNRSCYL